MKMLKEKIAATEMQKLEKDEQIRYLQEKCEELETSASTAETEHQNACTLLEVRLAAMEKVCEQNESLQLQLQVVASAKQDFEGSVRIQSLEQEHERLKTYQDVKAALEADIVVAQEHERKTQQQAE